MSYCSLDGMPWVASKMWVDALSGGKIAMKTLPAAENTPKIPLTGLFKLAGDVGDGYAAFNPTIVRHRGEYLVNLRCCRPGDFTTRNLIGTWRDNQLHDLRPLGDSTGTPTAYGFEDLRLFVVDDQLFAIAAVSGAGVSVGFPRTRQAVLRISDDLQVMEAHVVDSERHEKNWMPCVSPDGLKFVYTTDPLILMDWSYADRCPRPLPREIPPSDGLLRGGTQLTPYEGGYLAIVHQVHARLANGKHSYLHRFIRFSSDLRSVKIGRPFHFHQPGIEFAAGLVTEGARAFITFGVNDTEAYLAEVDMPTIAAARFLDEDTNVMAGGMLETTATAAPVPEPARGTQPVPTFVVNPPKEGEKGPPPVPPHNNPLMNLLG